MAARSYNDDRIGLMSDLSPAEQREINARMRRYKIAGAKDRARRKAKEIWNGPLPFVLIAVGAAGFIWWRKKKEAASLAQIQNP